jgi:hypothetical protein
MTFRPAFVAALLAGVLALPALASAATTVTASSTAHPSAVQTATVRQRYSISGTPTTSMGTSQTYDLTWTLPTIGQSGCLVCHDDKDLVRIKNGVTVSLYVNTDVLQASAHKNVPCTGCHTDFAYKTPHANATKSGEEWRSVAKVSCKNCHQDAAADFTNGAHSPSGAAGAASGTVGAPDSSAPGKPKPLCGDCHGGHSIAASNNVEAQKALHLSGIEMCGGCHEKDTKAFEDYYHGAAYVHRAPDAPSCWDCHSPHKILISTNRDSSVYKDHLYDTCHKCHKDPGDGYIDYAQLVHHKQDFLDANPLYAWISSARQTVQSIFGSIGSLFGKGS